MIDAIVSPLLELLISFVVEEAKDRVRLVTGIGEVKKLNGNLLAFQAVLKDAEQRQMKDNKAVRQWLGQLKDTSLLDNWLTARLKLQIKGFDDDNALALAPQKKKVCSFFPTAFCFGSFQATPSSS
ncbi:hypothetical protein AB3S75_015747 [Citrus x aurantiifolia]